MQSRDSRYTDPTSVLCGRCGWTGLVKDCIHTHRGYFIGVGDVVPVDLCPNILRNGMVCHSEDLIPLEQPPAALGLEPVPV